jgi:hypothetical protein
MEMIRPMLCGGGMCDMIKMMLGFLPQMPAMISWMSEPGVLSALLRWMTPMMSK